MLVNAAAMLVSLTLGLPPSIAQQEDRKTIRVPTAYEDWNLIESCATAIKLLEISGNDRLMEEFVHREDHLAAWTSYSGTPVVTILERERGCAYVRLVEAGETG